MTGQVFINYRPGDGEGWARRIFDQLSSRIGTEHLFMDVEGISARNNTVQARRDEVGRSDVVLAIIGRGWLEMETPDGPLLIDRMNDIVRVDLEAAVRENRRIIPILVDGAELPTKEQLPVPLKALAYRSAERVAEAEFGADVDRLVGSIRAALARAEAERNYVDEPEPDENEGLLPGEKPDPTPKVEPARRPVLAPFEAPTGKPKEAPVPTEKPVSAAPEDEPAPAPAPVTKPASPIARPLPAPPPPAKVREAPTRAKGQPWLLIAAVVVAAVIGLLVFAMRS